MPLFTGTSADQPVGDRLPQQLLNSGL